MHFTNVDAGGRRYRERTIGGRTYRYYADEGRALGSVWTDCPAMVANTPLRRETTGYPTQKPLKLLDRIVRASSREGGLVVDPFCGSGTTLVAAARLGRRFAGATSGSSRRAGIETSSERLPRRGRGVRAAGRLRPVQSAQGDGEASLLPLFLKLAGGTVLVVGAGPVAERKIESLLEARARVRLVAPDATRCAGAARRRGCASSGAPAASTRPTSTARGSSSRRPRTPRRRRSVGREATARRVFCVAVDDPPNASAYSGALVRRPPFTVAISSGGATPALTRLVREVIEHVLPGAEWVDHATRLRAKWLAEGTPIADRFAELVRDVKKDG